MKRGRPDRIEPPLFWFFHSEVIFSGLKVIGDYQDKKEPAIDIAGLCLPLKPQKERGYTGLSNNKTLGNTSQIDT